jgi:hypothetical protein
MNHVQFIYTWWCYYFCTLSISVCLRQFLPSLSRSLPLLSREREKLVFDAGMGKIKQREGKKKSIICMNSHFPCSSTVFVSRQNSIERAINNATPPAFLSLLHHTHIHTCTYIHTLDAFKLAPTAYREASMEERSNFYLLPLIFFFSLFHRAQNCGSIVM